MFGFLNVIKPSGITSHDVVARLRKVLKIKQIGHSGTLDPLADGVLPIAVGKATRLLEFLPDDKSYRATLMLGYTSASYDVESELEKVSDKKISELEFLAVLPKFRGEITQIPPAFSAVHYNGKRLYELAREGIIPDDIPKRNVFIQKLELIDFDFVKQTAVLDISCSKGTYIRSIINDVGQELSVGAVMSNLTRTAAGNFAISQAVELDKITTADEAQKCLINPLEVLSYKQNLLSDEELAKVKNGSAIENTGFEDGLNVSLVYNESLVAVAKVCGKLIKVSKVFL